MTVPVSKVPTVRAAILTGLQGAITQDGVASDPARPTLLVCLGDPGTYQTDDLVFIGDVTRDVTTLAIVGSGQQHWLKENFTVEIVVDVFRGGDNEAADETRAWSILAQIETWFRNDPSIGGLVLVARPGRTVASHVWDDEHAGRHVELRYAVDFLVDL